LSDDFQRANDDDRRLSYRRIGDEHGRLGNRRVGHRRISDEHRRIGERRFGERRPCERWNCNCR
jgi:hypothetical protein